MNTESIFYFLLIALGLIISSCDKETSNDPSGSGSSGNAEENVNASIILPPATFTVNPDTMSMADDVTIIPSNVDTVMPVVPGELYYTNIEFNAPNGNVTHGGIRFGPDGPIYMTPVETNGATSGTISIPFTIPEDVCANISQICHDVRCYEFAMTDDGAITSANIMNLLMQCAGCEEPSCQVFCCETIQDFSSYTFTANDVQIGGETINWRSCDLDIYDRTVEFGNDDYESGTGDIPRLRFLEQGDVPFELGSYTVNVDEGEFSDMSFKLTYYQDGEYTEWSASSYDWYNSDYQSTIEVVEAEFDNAIAASPYTSITIQINDVRCKELNEGLLDPNGATTTVSGSFTGVRNY